MLQLISFYILYMYKFSLPYIAHMLCVVPCVAFFMTVANSKFNCAIIIIIIIMIPNNKHRCIRYQVSKRFLQRSTGYSNQLIKVKQIQVMSTHLKAKAFYYVRLTAVCKVVSPGKWSALELYLHQTLSCFFELVMAWVYVNDIKLL